MIRAAACPHLLFDWPPKGTNPGWSFISGQSLCLQWHHKCPCRENNGWWIQRQSGTVDNGEKNSSVMESFQTIKGTHLGQTPLQNVVGRVSVAASETVVGSDGRRWDHQVITLNVYMKLCLCWRRSEERKTLCFYRLPGMCGGPRTSALLAFVILPPAINPLVVW